MTAEQTLLDANVLIALMDAADVHHARARRLYENISEDGELFLSDVTLNETLSVLARRCEARKDLASFPKFMTAFREAIRDIPILSLYELVPERYDEIMKLMVQHQARLSFHDCLIVLFLKEVPEVRLASFDADFSAIADLNLIS